MACKQFPLTSAHTRPRQPVRCPDPTTPDPTSPGSAPRARVPRQGCLGTAPQRVGHHLPPRPVIEGRVGRPLQRRKDPDPWSTGNSTVTRSCSPARDESSQSIRLGLGRPIHHRLRIQPGGDSLAAATIRASPIPSSVLTSAHNSASSSRRSSTSRHADSRTINVERHSDKAPLSGRPGCAASRAPTLSPNPGVDHHARANRVAPTPPRRPPHDPVWPSVSRRPPRRRDASHPTWPPHGPDPPLQPTSTRSNQPICSIHAASSAWGSTPRAPPIEHTFDYATTSDKFRQPLQLGPAGLARSGPTWRTHV